MGTIKKIGNKSYTQDEAGDWYEVESPVQAEPLNAKVINGIQYEKDEAGDWYEIGPIEKKNQVQPSKDGGMAGETPLPSQSQLKLQEGVPVQSKGKEPAPKPSKTIYFNKPALDEYERALGEYKAQEDLIASKKAVRSASRSEFQAPDIETTERLQQGLPLYQGNAQLAQKKIKPELDKVAEFGKLNAADFMDKTIADYPTPDIYKIKEYSKRVARDMGLKEDGFFSSAVYNTLKATVGMEIIRPYAESEFKRLFKERYGEDYETYVERNKKTLSEKARAGFDIEKGAQIIGSTKMKVEALGAEIKAATDEKVNGLIESMKPQADLIKNSVTVALEGFKNKYSPLIVDNKFTGTPEQFEQYQKEYAEIEALNNEANAQLQQLNDDFLKQQNIISTKANQRYRRQSQQIISDAETTYSKQLETFSQKYKFNPKFIAEVEGLHIKAYSNAIDKNNKLKVALSDVGANPITQYVSKFLGSLGSSIKGISSTLNIKGGEILGDYLQGKFDIGSDEIESFKDIFSPTKMAKGAGSIFGSAVIPMAAAGAVTIATGGAGAPAVVGGLLGGVASWLGETADIAGNMKSSIMEQTGDYVRANKSEKEVWKAQSMNLPLYAFDALPFMEGALGKISRKSLRVATGAGIEYFKELPQEYIQNLQEEAIRKDVDYRKAFDYSSWDKFTNTALQITPVMATGVVSQLSQKSDKEKQDELIKRSAKAFALKSQFNELAPNQRKQFIFDMMQRQGKAFTSTYLLTSYTNGQMDKATLDNMVDVFTKSESIIQKSKELGLTPAQQKVFSAFTFEHENIKNAMNEETDPIIKQALSAKLVEYETQMNNMVSNKKADYTVVVYPNNEQYIYTSSQMENALATPAFANALRKGDIMVQNFGENQALSDKIEEVKAQKIEPEVMGGVTLEFAEAAPMTLEEGGIIMELPETKKEEDVTEDQAGVPSEVGVGEELVQTEPVTETGEKAPPASGVLQAPRIEGEVQVTEEVVTEPKEGDVITLPPQREGFMPRQMVYKEGEWQQKVGGVVTKVSESVSQQAQSAWLKSVTPETKVTEDVGLAEGVYTQDTLDKVDTQKVPEGKRPLVKKILNDVRNVVKSIAPLVKKSTGKDLQVFLHTTDNTYGDAVLKAGGTKQDSKTKGFYLDTNGNIHINMGRMTSETMLHEGFHPVLDYMAKKNEEIINSLFDQLNSFEEGKAFVQRAQRAYTGDVTQKKEAITDFIAQVADGSIVINPSNFGKIKKFIVDTLNRLGFNIKSFKTIDVKNAEELVNLAQNISEKFKKGEEIVAESVSDMTSKGVQQFSIDERLLTEASPVSKQEKITQSPTSEKAVEENMTKLKAWVNNSDGIFKSAKTFIDAISKVFRVGNFTVDAPKKLIKYINDPNFLVQEISKVSPKQRELAEQGLKESLEVGKLYKNGKMTPVDTSYYFLWSICSTGISPYPHESGFLNAVKGGVDKYINMAAEGKFTNETLKEYEEWVKRINPTGQAGAQATANLNSFGRNFLLKGGNKITFGEFEGKTRIQALHDLISNFDLTTEQIRLKWYENFSGMAFNNKIFDFTLLVTGRTDLIVTDRVRTVDFWGASDNIYDGANYYVSPKEKPFYVYSINPKNKSEVVVKENIASKEEALNYVKQQNEIIKKEAKEKNIKSPQLLKVGISGSEGAGYSRFLSDLSGLAFNSAVNRALRQAVKNAYSKIGVNDIATVGRFHWETWVANSQQEVSHGTLGAIIQLKQFGDIKKSGIRQGKYGAWDFNFQYRFEEGLGFKYIFEDFDNNEYILSQKGYDKVGEEIEKQNRLKNIPENERFIQQKTRKTGQGVNEETGGLTKGWFEYEGTNTEKYFEFIKSIAEQVRPKPVKIEDTTSVNPETGSPKEGATQFSREEIATKEEKPIFVEQKEEYGTTVRPESGRERAGREKGGRLAPLEGAPSVSGINGPDPQLVAVAEEYAKQNRIQLKRQSEYAKVDPDRAKRIAEEYEKMKHDPQNPRVKEAYQNLINQTIAQYEALVDAGYKFWFIDTNISDNADYASSPYNALRDARQNKTMGVFPTTDGFGSNETIDVSDNPLMAETGFYWPVGGLGGKKKPVLANDLFRAVHDMFGHGLEGAGFRARGEENAWQAHIRLYTGSAVGAITSETRGQNSWLNFGPYGENNRTAKVEDTVFADQKTGLMPEWTWTEGRVGDMEGAQFSKEGTVEGTIDGQKVTFKKLPEGLDIVNGFYSPIEKNIRESKQDKMPAKQWLDKFGTGEEAKFTGLQDWLKSQTGSISKQDILDYLKENRIEINEIIKEEGKKVEMSKEEQSELSSLIKQDDLLGFDSMAEAKRAILESDNWVKNWDVRNERFIELGNKYRDSFKKYQEERVKYKEYQLPGEKTNYKEVLVTLPKQEAPGILTIFPSFDTLDFAKNEYGIKSQEYLYAKTYIEVKLLEKLDSDTVKRIFDEYESQKTLFKSSHYDEPNILAHIRMNTRVDAEGNKVLHIEEFQSDWGQKGKKEGFNYKPSLNDIQIIEDKRSYYDTEKKAYRHEVKIKVKGFPETDSGSYYPSIETIDDFKKGVSDSYSSVVGIPQAPFVMNTNTWVKLAWKVALKEAVKEGVDKITWTTGEQQNERYDLRKQVDEINYYKTEDGKYNITADKNGKSISSGIYKENELEGILGKEVAKKIIDNEGEDVDKYNSVFGYNEFGGNQKYKSLKGENLAVGGKGMLGFYGSPKEGKLGIVGEVAKSLFKQEPKTTKLIQEKYDSESNERTLFSEWLYYSAGEGLYTPEEVQLEIDKNSKLYNQFKKTDIYKEFERNISKEKDITSSQHSIDITPEIKEEVKSGLPQFSREEEIESVPEAKPIPSENVFKEAFNLRLAERNKLFLDNFGNQADKAKKLYSDWLKIKQRMEAAAKRNELDIEFINC